MMKIFGWKNKWIDFVFYEKKGKSFSSTFSFLLRKETFPCSIILCVCKTKERKIPENAFNIAIKIKKMGKFFAFAFNTNDESFLSSGNVVKENSFLYIAQHYFW